MNLTESTELVAVMQLHWPNHPWHEKADEAYFRGLADLCYAEVNAALTKAIRTCKFAPTVAELRDLIGANGEGMGEPESAWGEVKRAIANVGYYRAPHFDDPATAAAVNALGWQTLCVAGTKDEVANRAHFFATYRAYSTQIKQQRLREVGAGLLPVGAGSHREIGE